MRWHSIFLKCNLVFTSEQSIVQKTSLTGFFSYTYMNMRSNILLHCDQKIQKEKKNRNKNKYIYTIKYILQEENKKENEK
jgi:hypothetical protein